MKEYQSEKNRGHKRNEKRENRWRSFAVIFVTALSLSACALPFGNAEGQGKNTALQETRATDPSDSPERVDTGFIVTGPDHYDSADTTVLVEKNEDDKSVTFLNLELGKRYTLSIDGTTKLYDKYGESISLDQIQKGDVVDITFLKSKKRLTSMKLSSKAWSYSNVERYEINTVRGEVTIGEEVYKLTENTQYLSEGRNMEKMDLNPSDVLSFQGIDSQVVSVFVEKGHGYLRLVNDENFVGGWIEIGQSMIRRITEDMLLTVPEGNYQVNISHNGGGGTRNVMINRNEETTLDIGDMEVAEAQFGMVLFSVTPSSAEMYIDGSKVDASLPITLEYGLHQLIVRAEGYQSITQYIRVGQESAGIDIVLDKVDNDEDDEKSKSSSDTSQTDATSNYYKVYVDAPEGAEVYLDGNYVGISPCNFRKNYGSHVITLRKSGYETRSYTVQIDNEEKDISYSFADLVESGTAASKETGTGQ